MPYKTFWMPEHVVILCDVREVLTLSELKDMVDEIISYIEQLDCFVHIIIDARKLEKVTIKVHDVWHTSFTNMPNRGWGIIITDNSFFVLLSSMMAKLNKNGRFKNLTTMEATLEFIASVEPLAQTLTVEKINALMDSWETDTTL